jgi:hypothetical protein
VPCLDAATCGITATITALGIVPMSLASDLVSFVSQLTDGLYRRGTGGLTSYADQQGNSPLKPARQGPRPARSTPHSDTNDTNSLGGQHRDDTGRT